MLQAAAMHEAYTKAKAYVGLKEIIGSQHEREIVRFFDEVGHGWVQDDETAWCAAFAGAMLERAGLPSTRKLNARSYLSWGVGIDLSMARRGDIVVFRRGNSTWQGHVGFYVGHGGSKITVLGGNQKNAVGIDAYSIDDLLGVRRWPKQSRKPLPWWQRLWNWFRSKLGGK